MIQDNIILWQSFVFTLFGYLTAITLHSLFGFPRRLIESM